MGSRRQEKYSRMIQKELGEIFQRESSGWTFGNIVSVTKVEMSPDLGVAKIYLSFLKGGTARESFEALNKHKNEIRKQLGNRIAKSVRKIPEIVLYFDDGAEYAEKMNSLFRNLNIPPEDKPN